MPPIRQQNEKPGPEEGFRATQGACYFLLAASRLKARDIKQKGPQTRKGNAVEDRQCQSTVPATTQLAGGRFRCSTTGAALHCWLSVRRCLSGIPGCFNSYDTWKFLYILKKKDNGENSGKQDDWNRLQESFIPLSSSR